MKIFYTPTEKAAFAAEANRVFDDRESVEIEFATDGTGIIRVVPGPHRVVPTEPPKY